MCVLSLVIYPKITAIVIVAILAASQDRHVGVSNILHSSIILVEYLSL